MSQTELILSRREGHVGIAQLNRPDVYNALSFELLDTLAATLDGFDADPDIHVIVIHGSDKAFSAGADINNLAECDPVRWYMTDPLGVFDRISAVATPIVAAISGHALGGGCELAMMCDIVVASETAKFGQPEIKIGVIPGAGGTQRLIRSVGKALAMDMVLTGRTISAQEALAAGLVSRIAPVDKYLDEALALAKEMADGLSPVALRVAKEAVNKAHESLLTQGLREERNLFHLLTATEDQDEGMAAFLEKRPAKYKGR